MSKFQKSAMVLGAIYLVFTIASKFSSIILEADWSFKYTIWSAINDTLLTTAGASIALLLLFNAMQHKSKAAKTAAIISGVWLVVLVCSRCINIVSNYYRDLEEYARNVYWLFELSTSASVLQLIAIGFFADSHRKNKAVLISSISLSTVALLGFSLDCLSICLAPTIGYPAGIMNTLYLIKSILTILATCAWFACVATVKDKK